MSDHHDEAQFEAEFDRKLDEYMLDRWPEKAALRTSTECDWCWGPSPLLRTIHGSREECDAYMAGGDAGYTHENGYYGDPDPDLEYEDNGWGDHDPGWRDH